MYPFLDCGTRSVRHGGPPIKSGRRARTIIHAIDVLRLTTGARLARASKREVVAKPMSRKQRRFLARMAWVYRADPATRGLCLLIQ